MDNHYIATRVLLSYGQCSYQMAIHFIEVKISCLRPSKTISTCRFFHLMKPPTLQLLDVDVFFSQWKRSCETNNDCEDEIYRGIRFTIVQCGSLVAAEDANGHNPWWHFSMKIIVSLLMVCINLIT